MKTIILCGGEGTRMREETEFKPKPLVLVGGKPILWHIMKIYSHYGYNEFVLALGYKGHMIKDYFLNRNTFLNNFTLNTKTNELTFHNNECDDFTITFVETGEKSLTGERVLRLSDYVGEEFMLTYGDGVADIDIGKLVEFHKKQNTLCTITGVHPSTRFGLIKVDEGGGKAKEFYQKMVTSEDPEDESRDYVNGGFMVMKREILEKLEKDSMIETLFPKLIEEKQLSVYTHEGSWRCMDTYKEVKSLNDEWESDPFWKVW